MARRVDRRGPAPARPRPSAARSRASPPDASSRAIAGERGGEIAARGVDAREAGDRERMIREGEGGVAILALGVGQASALEVQIAELRVVPGLRLGIVGARGVERPSASAAARRRDRPAARARRRRGRRPRPTGGLRIIAIEGGERGVVLAELEVRVADDAVVPARRPARFARASLGGGDGIAEAMLRGEHGAQHPLRLVARARGDRGAQRRLRLDGEPAVAAGARLAQQRVGEPRRRDAVAGLVRDTALRARRSSAPARRVTSAAPPGVPAASGIAVVRAASGAPSARRRRQRRWRTPSRESRVAVSSSRILVRVENPARLQRPAPATTEGRAEAGHQAGRRPGGDRADARPTPGRARYRLPVARRAARRDTGSRAGTGRRCRRRRRRARCSASG